MTVTLLHLAHLAVESLIDLAVIAVVEYICGRLREPRRDRNGS